MLICMHIKLLSAIIDLHFVKQPTIADNLQLQLSAPPLLHSMQSSIINVNASETVIMLKLHDNKTELMLVTLKN